MEHDPDHVLYAPIRATPSEPGRPAEAVLAWLEAAVDASAGNRVPPQEAASKTVLASAQPLWLLPPDPTSPPRPRRCLARVPPVPEHVTTPGHSAALPHPALPQSTARRSRAPAATSQPLPSLVFPPPRRPSVPSPLRWPQSPPSPFSLLHPPSARSTWQGANPASPQPRHPGLPRPALGTRQNSSRFSLPLATPSPSDPATFPRAATTRAYLRHPPRPPLFPASLPRSRDPPRATEPFLPTPQSPPWFRRTSALLRGRVHCRCPPRRLRLSSRTPTPCGSRSSSPPAPRGGGRFHAPPPPHRRPSLGPRPRPAQAGRSPPPRPSILHPSSRGATAAPGRCAPGRSPQPEILPPSARRAAAPRRQPPTSQLKTFQHPQVDFSPRRIRPSPRPAPNLRQLLHGPRTVPRPKSAERGHDYHFSRPHRFPPTQPLRRAKSQVSSQNLSHGIRARPLAQT